MQQDVSSQTSRHPLWLLAGFRFWVVIAIAVVLRRLIELIRPPQGSPPRMASLDATFSSHAALTLAHIIPAAIFVILAAYLGILPIAGRRDSSFLSVQSTELRVRDELLCDRRLD
jgi:hypothetical protein